MITDDIHLLFFLGDGNVEQVRIGCGEFGDYTWIRKGEVVADFETG